MAGAYQITLHGPEFIVTENAGATVGIYSTELQALREVKTCEQDDLMLKAARSLVEKAVANLIRKYRIDRKTACGWIKEAAD